MSAADFAAHRRAQQQDAEAASLWPLWEGEVVLDAKPGATTVRVRAERTAGGDEFHLGEAPWVARIGRPKAGDKCLVGFDETHAPWIVAWRTPYQIETLAEQEPLVEALPAEPKDKQIVNYLVSNSAGIIWRLRYRAASASSHKWEFAGGPWLSNGPYGQSGPFKWEAGNINTWRALGTEYPKLTVPLTGDYAVSSAVDLWDNALGAILTAGVKYTASVATGASPQVSVAGSWWHLNDGPIAPVSLTAGEVIDMRFNCSAVSEQYYSHPLIAIQPIRVG